MHFTFENPICPCGSKQCFQECQLYSVQEKWTTRAERELDPSFVPASCYPAVWVSDPGWFICDECKNDADLVLVKAELAKIDWKKMKWYEELGVALINPRAASKGNKRIT